MTLLALLRHGETEWSRDKRVQGRSDQPLSTAGCATLARLQLPAACAHMVQVSSPLRRCSATAQQLGLRDVAQEARIAEMSWGEWEGRRLPDLRAELGQTMAANEARGFDFCPPGGESPRRVLERVRPWLAEVAARGRPTLAISHRGVMRVIFAAACGWDMLGRPPAKLDWGALQVFRLDAHGAPQIEQLNLPLCERSGVEDRP